MKNTARQQNEQLADALRAGVPEVAEKRQGLVRARAGRCRMEVKPANVEAVAKRLSGAHRVGVNTNKRFKEDRWYPPFEAGKTMTADYVRAYQRLNARTNLSEWKFSHAAGVASTYAGGALDFEPLVEIESNEEELVADLL